MSVTGFASYAVFGQKISHSATEYIDALQLKFHVVPIIVSLFDINR